MNELMEWGEKGGMALPCSRLSHVPKVALAKVMSEYLTCSLPGAMKEPTQDDKQTKTIASAKEKNSLDGRRVVKRTIEAIITTKDYHNRAKRACFWKQTSRSITIPDGNNKRKLLIAFL